ncbi:TRAP transporter substrate-binding protein [Halothiobacillus sp.]|uniref:TRAP transporter substrate-binding protein n=1 Tax=Halothiobacillus sp. TaxID=1891311 RepID=UPI00260CF9F7|nr:TRAP transporter substrate-binding protein [Halothiobacillus sp.]
MVTAWPKGLPGLGTGAELLARRITVMSSGRLTVKVFSAGELVPGLQTFDAVQNGAAEMGHDTPGFHLGKHRAFAYFFGAPFGMSYSEHVAWLDHGGGQALWDELSAQFGIKSFAVGNIGTPPFGWFKKELHEVGDLKGVKMRMPGIGAEMIRRLGAVPTLMAPGDVFPALKAGTLDATDFTGPANDMALGFHQACKFYYWPGVQKPGAVQQLIVSKSKYDALPKDLQQIIQVAAQASHQDMLAEYNLINAQAAKVLKDKHGIKFLRLPDSILSALGTVAGEILHEEREKLDPLGRRIWDAYFAARSGLVELTEGADRAMYNARDLGFEYPA